MKLVKFEEQHYHEVCSWWTQHGHPVLPFNMLSTFGLMAFEGEQPICVSFVYLLSDCNIAQIAWTTTNPEAPIRMRYEGVDSTVKGLLGVAKKYNKTNVLCLSDSRGLKKIISRNGLKELKDHTLLYGSLGAL